MATTRTISWQLPTVGARQRALAHTLVEYRVKAPTGQPALPWTLQDQVAASSEQKLVITDVAPGTFEYQLTAVDVDGQRGPSVVAEASKAYDPPGQVTGVQIVDAAA
jgi:hypothetical protein